MKDKNTASPNPIRKVVILGGGTAGWMTAAALSKFLGPLGCKISLIESDTISTVGVGEATIPHIRVFNQMLGIDEREFMTATNATFKLAIHFQGWGAKGNGYFHPFGDHGYPINGVPFHHYWLKAKRDGLTVPFDDFSLPILAAKTSAFTHPQSNIQDVESTYSYAYHLDATLYAQFLRRYSENNGVERIEGLVEAVALHSVNGFIKSVRLKSGLSVEGDLFVDCSGFRSVLLGKALNTAFEDWSHWLPCDRAIAMPSEPLLDFPPYTQALAHKAGWQWRIPLQNRVGNGHVYASEFMADKEAEDILVSNLPSKPLGDPRHLKFTAGVRSKSWHKNCVAIGLSSGFLEPLESTSIYLIQLGIFKLLAFFPTRDFTSEDEEAFNAVMKNEYEIVRDFIILHYKATQRDDSEFWRYCSAMDVPDTLKHKMSVFQEQGYVQEYEYGLFLQPSWLAVYLGQGFYPRELDPRVTAASASQVRQHLEEMASFLRDKASHMPNHQAMLQGYLQSSISQVQAPLMSLYGTTDVTKGERSS